MGEELLNKMLEFNNNYKKKLKKDRKNSFQWQGQGQDLLTPDRYHQKNSKNHS